MSEFAKTFTIENIGQVLLYKDAHRETFKAAVVIMIDGRGDMRPQTTLSFSSGEKRDDWFDRVDEEVAHEWAQRLSTMLERAKLLEDHADIATPN